MCSIREGIKDHLRMSYGLHVTANELLRGVDEPGFQKKIGVVAKDNGLPVAKLRSKFTILQRKQAYYDSKSSIENILKVVFNEGLSKARAKKIYANKIASTLLEHEYDKREKLGSLYQYDELVKPSGVFTYLEEASLLNDLNICINSTQGRCHCQVCSLVHIKKIAYKLAKRENKNYATAWNNQKEADLEWIYDYEMRHYDEISNLEGPNSCLLESQASTVSTSRGHLQKAIPSTSRGHLQEAIPSTSRGHLQEAIPSTSRGRLQEAIPSTSRGHLQGDIKQEQHSYVYSSENIKKHMNLSPRLTEAANQVLYKEKNIIDIALKDDLDLWILQRKVEISKRTNKYLEQKFELAIQDYSLDLDNSDNETKLNYVACKNDIGKEYMKHLEKELVRHINSLDYYMYEKIIISYEVITSEEEEKIIKQLYQRETECRCQLCVMEYLAEMEYTFAKQENIKYPSVWDEYKHVDELWLFEFEMRYSEQIARFPSISLCKRSPASTASSSLHEQTEPTTTSSSYVQIKRPKLSKDSKVLKPEERLLIINGWIKRYIEISDRLDKAATRVLRENKDIGRIAYEHNLDIWILNKKVNIIKFRKTQFDIKRKHEDAVNAVKLNILSVSDAAEEYKVDKDFIHDSLQKLENSDSNVYLLTYVNLETDDTMLELDEEFKFLKYFKRQISNDPDCNCRSCALLKLPNLAHEFTKNMKRLPSVWNKTGKADVIWTCEFIMRHSITISNYLQKECIYIYRVSQNS